MQAKKPPGSFLVGSYVRGFIVMPWQMREKRLNLHEDPFDEIRNQNIENT